MTKAGSSASIFRPDNFTILLIATVVLASLLPATGRGVAAVDGLAQVAIALLFFLHGARLSREAAWAGLIHWRLHLVVIACSFLLFPALGLLIGAIGRGMLDSHLLAGLIFLCCLPSTVQSSIAFVSIARGNVPAAVCAASLSNLSGVFVTPLLAGLLLSREAGFSYSAILTIATQLLLPFMLGQYCRRWIGGWIGRHRTLVNIVDRGSILLMVYSAFGKSVTGGFWQRADSTDLIVLALVCLALLIAMLVLTTVLARRLGFSRADEITIVFCGSKKSLATGVPMANVLFPTSAAGVVTLPIIIFHQLQLIACAMLARHYARRNEGAGEAAPSGHP